MRVVNVAQPTTAGVARCVADLVRGGLAADLDVTVVCPDDGPLGPELRDAGATWEPLAMDRSPGRRDLVAVARLRPLLADADVVHLHSSKAGAVGRLAVRRGRRGPVVAYTPHGWGWLVGGPMAPVYRRVERALAGRADVIIAVSEEDREAGAPVLGRRADRLRVIPKGVDVTRFGPDGPVADRTDDPLVVCVGRLSRQKGQDVAVDALRRLAAGTARLRLVGDGPDRPALEEQARRLGVSARVELVGSTDPSPHLRAADVVIVPSRWDALSLSLLEAMATGRPVVATDAAGSATLDGVGTLVPVDDAPALASAVDDLLDDRDERERLGAAARERVLERHRLDAMVTTTVDLWRSLAARR